MASATPLLLALLEPLRRTAALSGQLLLRSLRLLRVLAASESGGEARVDLILRPLGGVLQPQPQPLLLLRC